VVHHHDSSESPDPWCSDVEEKHKVTGGLRGRFVLELAIESNRVHKGFTRSETAMDEVASGIQSSSYSPNTS
jgi:hypothetical protein